MNARLALAGLGLFGVAACGGSAAPRTPTPLAGTIAAATPSPAADGATATGRSPRVVIADEGTTDVVGPDPQPHAEVRVARLDATDVGMLPGEFVGIFDNQVIARRGAELEATSYDGHVTHLGTLAVPSNLTLGAVVASPDLSQWLYTTTPDSQSLTAQIHVGCASGDRIVATIPSPNGNGVFAPFAWNSSGVYLVLQATGIGGVGPFLEYHFPLYRFDLATGREAAVEPQCVAYYVLTSGAFICAADRTNPHGGLEVRRPNGQRNAISVDPFAGVTLSTDETRIALAGLGGTPADRSYQLDVGELGGSAVSAFGVRGFFPEAWLPDGRLVVDQRCMYTQGDYPAVCTHDNDGTRYILAADGSSSTRFYKLADTARVAGILT